MTAEELKSKIQFTEKPHPVDGYIIINGSIKFESELTIYKQELDEMEEAKKSFVSRSPITSTAGSAMNSLKRWMST